MPEYLPLHPSGKAVTRTASAAIVGGQLVMVTGPGTVGPATAATPAWMGIAATDVAAGDPVTVYSESVQFLTAAATITAGQLVDTAAAGQAQPHTNGTTDYTHVGLALTSGTAGQLVEVKFRR